MNKKLLTALCICSVLLAALLIGVILMGARGEKPVTDPNGTEAQISANAGTETGEQMESAPTDPSGDTQPADPSEPGDTLPTEPEETQTEPTTPADPTIPPENVEMGTAKGEDDSGIEDDEVNVTNPTQGKEPEQTTPPTENPNPDGNILGEDFDITKLTYEEFMAMSGEQQRAVIDLFGSPEDFMVWFKAVEAIYKAEHPDIEIGGDGTVNP